MGIFQCLGTLVRVARAFYYSFYVITPYAKN